jgi:hypothetical protein
MNNSKLTRTESGFTWKPTKDLTYEIEPRNPRKSNYVVALYHGGELIYRTSINLDWDQKRVSFAKKCEGVDRKQVERQLVELSDLLKRVETKPAAPEPKTPEDYIDDDNLTEAEMDDIARFLRNPDMVSEILDDFAALGHVGENQNKLLAYLVGTSRLTEEPLSLIVQGESGAGKSHLVETLKEMMPPEVVKFWSRVTSKALYHMPEEALAHKLVIMAEREGGEDSDYSIRTLQSEKQLVLETTVKDEATGGFQTVLKTVLGPIAYVETTTRDWLNPENTSRCFVIDPDTSPCQTQLIAHYLKSVHAGRGISPEERERMRRKHRNAQRSLAPGKARIPFVDAISYPTDSVTTRREFPRLLQLIGISALLHQFQRDGKELGDGTIEVEASIDDYRVAYRLACDLLSRVDRGLDHRSRQLLDTCRKVEVDEGMGDKPDPQGYHITLDALVEATTWSRSTVDRYVHKLVDQGFLEPKHEDGARGYTARYRVKEKVNEPTQGIPRPEEVEAAWKGSTPDD